MFVIVDGSPIATKDIVVVVASSLYCNDEIDELPQNNYNNEGQSKRMGFSLRGDHRNIKFNSPAPLKLKDGKEPSKSSV